MKNIIKIEKDVRLPGTNIIFEKGDIVKVISSKNRIVKESTSDTLSLSSYLLNLDDDVFEDIFNEYYTSIDDANTYIVALHFSGSDKDEIEYWTDIYNLVYNHCKITNNFYLTYSELGLKTINNDYDDTEIEGTLYSLIEDGYFYDYFIPDEELKYAIYPKENFESFRINDETLEGYLYGTFKIVNVRFIKGEFIDETILTSNYIIFNKNSYRTFDNPNEPEVKTLIANCLALYFDKNNITQNQLASEFEY